MKFCTEVREWPAYTAVKYTAERFNHLSRVHQHYRPTDRQTNGFTIAKTRT